MRGSLQRACVRSLSCQQDFVCAKLVMSACVRSLSCQRVFRSFVNVNIAALCPADKTGKRVDSFDIYQASTLWKSGATNCIPLPFEAPSSPANSGSIVVIRWTRINRSLHCICWLLHSVPQALANHRHYPVPRQVGVAGTWSG